VGHILLVAQGDAVRIVSWDNEKSGGGQEAQEWSFNHLFPVFVQYYFTERVYLGVGPDKQWSNDTAEYSQNNSSGSNYSKIVLIKTLWSGSKFKN
jgi:hypothetical protein